MMSFRLLLLNLRLTFIQFCLFWIKTLDANDKHEVILLLKSRTTFVNVPSVNPFETKVKIDPGKRTTKIFKKWKFQNVLIAHFRNVDQFKLRITWWKFILQISRGQLQWDIIILHWLQNARHVTHEVWYNLYT